MHITLADDEKSIRITLGDEIRDAGHTVSAFDNGMEAFEYIRDSGTDVLISDLKMPGMEGMELIRRVLEINPLIKIILITGYGTVDTAVEAMKAGAYDYVVKPFLNEKLVHMLKHLQDLQRLSGENDNLRQQLNNNLEPDFPGFEGMIGTSQPMQTIFRTIENIAETDANVLIEGESGTGKELVARAIHNRSPRAKKEMIVLSCAASPENLVEDELFGHEAGAFTGAIKTKSGKFERADGSTLFIDDIDDMSLNTQVKLIRVLQERTFERLGGTKVLHTDFRIIAASKRNLKKMAEEGAFREDLFFRLNIIPVCLPPLRKRKGDIELLAHYFKSRYAKNPKAHFTEETMRLIQSYSWPGNIRELENAVIRATALCGNREDELKKDYIFQAYEADGSSIRPLSIAAAEFEKQYIQQVLHSTNGHRTKAAELLSISRKTLWEKMKTLGIE